jgi:major vault protein
MANANFLDDEKIKREAGCKWLINGPRDYIPPIEVVVLESRDSIPLDKNEGFKIN